MESLEISTESWHWRIYMFGAAMWAKFLHNPLYCYERPNRCSYIRTIFIYLPVMLVLNLTIYTSPFWLIGSIYYKYGPGIFMETIARGSGWTPWIAMAALGIILVRFFLRDVLDERDAALQEQEHEEWVSCDRPAAQGDEERASFTKILLQFLQDRHDMVCRQIVIKESCDELP